MTKVKHSAENARLYRLAATGDIEARNQLVESHLGLVVSIATYYAKRNKHLEMDDLVQEGRIGIIDALQKFNVDKGFRFSTYATYWIRHHIQRYVVSNHSGGATASKKDSEAYISRTMPEDERGLYEARCVEYTSITRTSSGGTALDELVEDREEVPFEDAVEVRAEWHEIERSLFHETISPEQRTVMCMRFGVMGFRPHTINEVASKVGMPPLRVTAIEQTTTMHISKLMEEDDGDHRDEALDSGGAEGEAESWPQAERDRVRSA